MNIGKTLGLLILGFMVISSTATALSGTGGIDPDQSRIAVQRDLDRAFDDYPDLNETVDVIWEGTVTLTPGETFSVVPYDDPFRTYEFSTTTGLGALDAAAKIGGVTYEMVRTDGTQEGLLIWSINEIAYRNEGDYLYTWGIKTDEGYRYYDFSGQDVMDGETVYVHYLRLIYNETKNGWLLDDILYEVRIEVAFTEPVLQSKITLAPGWNFVSTPKRLAEGSDTVAIFSGVDTAGHSLYTYEPGAGFVALNASDTIRPLDGIWVYANRTAEIPLNYGSAPMTTPPTKALVAGWNAIGCTDRETISAADGLVSIRDRWSHLIGFDATTQAYEAAIFNGAGDGLLHPAHGYWVFMRDEGTIAAICG